MIADVALPAIFSRLRNLRLVEGEVVKFGGWAFRGLMRLPVTWDRSGRH
jgi:cytochrome P450